MSFFVVVPARLGSTRLPNKVLRDLAGKPLIQWTWQAACNSGAARVIIATDSVEVATTCTNFGACVQLTSPEHASGTDRVSEVAAKQGWADEVIVVNLQGDEPLMPPSLLRRAAELLETDQAADVATLAHPLTARAEWLDPSFVKVVCNSEGYALYFSRAPIPWMRDGNSPEPRLPPYGLALRHIGLYAYRVAALRRISSIPIAPLEQCESLEQLRALSNGLRIAVAVVHETAPRGVDTEDDLLAVAGHIRQQT